MFTSVLLWMWFVVVAVLAVWNLGRMFSRVGTPEGIDGVGRAIATFLAAIPLVLVLLCALQGFPANQQPTMLESFCFLFGPVGSLTLVGVTWEVAKAAREGRKKLRSRLANAQAGLRGWLVFFGRYIFVPGFTPTPKYIQGELGLLGLALWRLGWLHFVEGFTVRRDVRRDAKYRLNLYAATSPNANPLAFWTAVGEAERRLACFGRNNEMTLDATGEVQSVLRGAIAGADGVSIRARITTSRKYGRDVETVGAGAPWPWIDYSAIAIRHFQPIKWSDGGSVAVRLKAVLRTQPGSEAVLGTLGARLHEVEWQIRRYLERLRRGGAGRHEVRADTATVRKISGGFARKCGFTIEVRFSSSPPPAAPPVVTTLVIP